MKDTNQIFWGKMLQNKSKDINKPLAKSIKN